ncbi:unnamed protein product [Mesocestoides corti]|uniref:Uncharacterized protein n=1 Tax=Mesocestoides corti TaxID=53468 RepID=A0A0R3U8P9_MESCO|nr:unnamed protein product [Mesocestoides corti]
MGPVTLSGSACTSSIGASNARSWVTGARTASHLSSTNPSGSTISSFSLRLTSENNPQEQRKYTTILIDGLARIVTSTKLSLLNLDWFERLGLANNLVSSICDALHSSKLIGEQTTDIITRFASILQPGLGHCSATEATLRLLPDPKPIFRIVAVCRR